ncbi:MAG: hypothetical protein JXX14_18820 [Deltaproteobacteria bacterium]|nr:hypothetical protein [Deltaproteobacteria bacterium]
MSSSENKNEIWVLAGQINEKNGELRCLDSEIELQTIRLETLAIQKKKVAEDKRSLIVQMMARIANDPVDWQEFELSLICRIAGEKL